MKIENSTISPERLTQLKSYVYDIIGCCQDVHKELGPWLYEYMYQVHTGTDPFVSCLISASTTKTSPSSSTRTLRGTTSHTSLLRLKSTYILEAISTLRFMYCAKSLEFIDDCCDAAIFRILRSVTSLWNWLRNVMIHSCYVSSAAKLRKNSELSN